MTITVDFVGAASPDHPHGEPIGSYELVAVPAAGDRVSLSQGIYLVLHRLWNPDRHQVTVVIEPKR